MKRCTIVIPDAGPLNSLWVAGQLPLLLKLDMKIVVVDAVYDEVTSEPEKYPKDKAVKQFIEENSSFFVIESTSTGIHQRNNVAAGGRRSKNAGEVAIVDFMSADDGLSKYLKSDDPVIVLFEDADVRNVRFIRKPPNLHLLSTVGMLRGMERSHVISSADEIIQEMTHPSKATLQARVFNDLPDGVDEPAEIGSIWEPPRPN